jgi:serine/threonine protein kinase
MTAGGSDRLVIDGRFELLERLGGGGMGQVWRARDLMLQRDVALKEVTAPASTAFGADPAQAGVLRERVLREAQALARLHHPNVVTIFHIVDTPALPHPWLVMELVTGGSLHDRLSRGPLTIPEAARIGRGVLSALRSAHAAGIQHRDVKPGNVLLRTDGTPVLTDFGIAALQESPGLTATGMLIGSPEFMAPERIHGQEGNPASDLWSLGLLLYVGLEGYNPLRRDTTIATIAAVVDAPIPAPTRAGAMAPVLAGLLVRDPAHRSSPEWIDQMLADVERAVATGSDYSTVAPTFQFAQPRPQQTPTPAAVQDQVRNPYDQRERGTDMVARRKRRVLTPYLASLMTFGIAGGTIWIVHNAVSNSALKQGAQNSANSGSTTGGADSGSPTDAQSTPAAPTGGKTQDAPAATTDAAADLLTPAGTKAMVAALEQADGNTNIVSMTVYPDYASFEVVKSDDHTLYDNWTYRNGVAAFDSAGGTLDTDQNTINPASVKWDMLTPLFKQAATSLKVPHPKDRFWEMDSDIITQVPEVRVYLSDDYGSGYIAATLQGKVTRIDPKGS